MQIASIEYARNVLGLQNATSQEFDADTPEPIISLMEGKNKEMIGGTLRLGLYSCTLKDASKAKAIYGTLEVKERHRHRYEFNNTYREAFENAGFVFSGINTEKNLVEIIELKDHKWFIASQFHPEFSSRPNKCHPLFREFVSATLEV